MLMSRIPKTDPKVAVLRDCFGFSGARERDLSALAMLFDEVRVAPGERLVREGESGREFFLIVAGQAAVSFDGQPVAAVYASGVTLIEHTGTCGLRRRRGRAAVGTNTGAGAARRPSAAGGRA